MRAWVVEDSATDALLAKYVLRELGATTVESISTGAAFLDRVARENEPPDFLLLDLIMTPPDGYQIIARLRRASTRWQAVPLVVCTSAADAFVQSVRERDLRMLGVRAVIQKPVTAEKLRPWWPGS
jgi:CheY-like chemotaxis protein